MTAQEFLKKIEPYARAVQVKYGIPWMMTATQAAVESTNGNSGLTVKANNLFGVTGDGTLKKAGVSDAMTMPDVKAWLINHPEVPILIMETAEQSNHAPETIRYWTRPGDIKTKIRHGVGTDLTVERPFRKYANWTESLQDWVSLIMRRYSVAYHCAISGDSSGFFEHLQSEGYATNRKYAALLKQRYSDLESLA